MHFSVSGILIVSVSSIAGALNPRSTTGGICPILGQQLPAPTGLSTAPTFQAAAKSLVSKLNAALDILPFNETTFSIGMFTLSDPGLVFQYDHTDPSVATSKIGANKVDNNSIYRIGSMTKLLTVYSMLINKGDRLWNSPVTEYVPELLAVSNSTLQNLGYEIPAWCDIELGDLAGQMAGLARDVGLADLAPANEVTLPLSPAVRATLPKLPSSEVPSCGYILPTGEFAACSEDDYIRGLATEAPIFASAYTPAYSNEGFALLGIALSKMVGASMDSIFNTSFINPLKLASTSYSVPASITSNSVIPDGSPLKSYWAGQLGVLGAAGSAFSSVSDFATIGKAMLSSTLISAATTRRWLKPTSFVEDFAQAVGRPWEIFRLPLGGHSVDLYTKAGDLGAYSTFFALVPEYDFGVVLLSASATAPGAARNVFPSLLASEVLPALPAVAAHQALSRFVGNYTSAASRSALVVTADDALPALRVAEFVYNGTDLFEHIFGLVHPDLDYRMVPNQLAAADPQSVGFTSVYQATNNPLDAGAVYWPCEAWNDVDELTYGNVPLGQVTFQIGSDGKATGVRLEAWRTTLTRED